MMSTIAIIPARGGSKRIPGKNVREFKGKPMIYYPIQLALKSGLFDEVMVSTDSEEIAEISRQCGASVPFLRSQVNSNDHATTEDVLLEVVESYKEEGTLFRNLCCIYPTTPSLTVHRLNQGLELIKDEFNSVVSIVPYDSPIQRAFETDGNNLKMKWPEFVDTRTQDLQQAFHDAGQFYWLDVENFRKHKSLFTEPCGFVLLKKNEVQDIDTPEDWALAEFKFDYFNKSGK